MKSLNQRSNALGFLQTLGFLGVLISTGSLAWYSAYHFGRPVTVGLVFLHGTVFAFLPNGIHELGHGTVFRTKRINAFFNCILSFLAWINCEMFKMSHVMHHRFTLHPPDDLEVVLPLHVVVRDFFLQGFVSPASAILTVWSTIRASCGQLQTVVAGAKLSTKWLEALYGVVKPEERRKPIRWARILLAGHGLILAISIYFHLWMLPVLTTFAPFYGSWLFFLCNNTQHIGLQDKVPDFRLCSRTFILNPVVGFLYWHMNYHIEHHMYPAVPCYKLARLRALIQFDLPPCTNGLIATWLQIAAIQRRQRDDPSYQYAPPLPRSDQGVASIATPLRQEL